MFSNTESNSPPIHNERHNLKNIYQKFQSFLGRGSDGGNHMKEDMLSARASTVASDDSFVTPVSSVGDLLNMSPKRIKEHTEHPDVTGDLLTGTEFDSICDVTMQEVPMYDDIYIDANSLDYLVKCAESNRHHNIVDRGKESLFVKFDPLYARQQTSLTTTESLVDSTEGDVGYETGSSASVLADSHVASPKHTVSAGSVLTNNNKDKPMQVVPPVVNDVPKASVTQTRSTPALIRSMSAILTPTQVATDRLISISGSTPPTAAPRSPRLNTTTQVDRLHSLRIILQKQDHEIIQLSHENRQLKSSLQEVQYRYSQTVEDMEAKIKRLSDERDNLLDRENKLIQQVNDKIMSNKQMSIVMEEYEKTISSLIGEQQQEKLQYQAVEERLTSERDQALNHLASMESSFNDLLAKYEKCKSIILEAKDREKVFEQKIIEYENGMKKYEKLYNDLKHVTSEALNKANETLDTTKKNYNMDIMKQNAIIKKHEITIASLQESLTQKSRDNEELTRICDQLINEVR
ncbi:uncharacterized protein LOC126374791 [Pectinophora gossypiella]|uniref:uncharacterized protein LOC126374791 n=1 Tax=Pectinophora gossypiella TaxID=13191 RepID=UPI00214E8C2A|nr:uncharacterized protein LOC126374791 [Pectinophora gossypiella]